MYSYILKLKKSLTCKRLKQKQVAEFFTVMFAQMIVRVKAGSELVRQSVSECEKIRVGLKLC